MPRPFSQVVLLGHTGYIGRRLAVAFGKAAPDIPVVGRSVTELDLTKPATSLLILRPALVYGPEEPGYYYGPSGFLQKARAGAPITLWGDGSELREFLFIDDVVDVTTRLLCGGACGVLNVVSGASYTYAA